MTSTGTLIAAQDTLGFPFSTAILALALRPHVMERQGIHAGLITVGKSLYFLLSKAHLAREGMAVMNSANSSLPSAMVGTKLQLFCGFYLPET